MKHLNRIICLLLFIINVSLFAQEFGYKHYTTQDGLVQSQVMSLFQDSKGYIWIGTKGGVSRFDGVSFMNLIPADGLFNSQVLSIIEDYKGTIWFLTNHGISGYDGHEIKSYPAPDSKNSTFLGFYEKNPGVLILMSVNSENQIIFHQFSEGKYTLQSTLFPATNPAFPDAPVHYGVYDPATRIFWLASQPYGLYKISESKTEKLIFNIKDLQGLTMGKDHKLYIFANDSAFRIEQDSAHFLFTDKHQASALWLKDCVADKDGNVFFDDNYGRLLLFDKKKVFKDRFNFKEISTLFTDNENNLWIGTEFGLYRQLTRSFINYSPANSGIGDLIWNICEDKRNRMWFSSFIGGLQYLEDGNFIQAQGYQKLIQWKDPRFYMGGIIDHDKNILFPMSFIGGLRFDGSVFTKIFPDSIDPATLFFFEDPVNFDLYAGTSIGLYRISEKHGSQNLNIQPGNGKNRMVVSIIKDKLNRFWFGGFNGITILQGEQKIHLPTKELPFDKGANAMLPDTRKNLWIGNADGLYNYNYKKFSQIIHPGIHSMISSLALIGDSALLIGSASGLAILDLKAYYDEDIIILKVIDKIRGFEGIEVGQNAIFRDSKGLYWIATADRVVQFNPALYKSNSTPPATYINGISILNNKMEWIKADDSLKSGNSYRFSNDQKNLRFDFIGISTTAPEGVRYSYYLEGYDKGWSVEVTGRYAVYTNLPPGEYNLLLKSCNADGVWTPEPTNLAFRIVPALYQRTWFWILFIILLSVLLVFSGVVISNRRKKAQHRKLNDEKRLAQLQLLTLKNQIDPHFTFNAINSIGSAVLKENKELAYKYFVKLSRLMRSIIGSSDNLICSLGEELEFVKDYLDINKFRFKDKFDYIINVAPEVDLSLPIPKMAIQSFSENALKHGILHLDTGGMLTISIYSNKGDLKLMVEDNGIGREMAGTISETSTGKGLIIMKGYFDYFNRYNQRKVSWLIIDLYNEQGEARGTRVEVNIPSGFSYDEHEINQTYVK